jgi:hypothetical protein
MQSVPLVLTHAVLAGCGTQDNVMDCSDCILMTSQPDAGLSYSGVCSGFLETHKIFILLYQQ